MNNEDMSNIMEQINNMMKNNQIPDDIKNIVNNITNNKSDSNSNSNTNDEKDMSSDNRDSSFPEFDMATIMKMKNIMDSMKSSQNDPRSNLLKSLKPYLRESRKDKVDQYIQLFGMEKVFEMMNPLRRW